MRWKEVCEWDSQQALPPSGIQRGALEVLGKGINTALDSVAHALRPAEDHRRWRRFEERRQVTLRLELH